MNRWKTLLVGAFAALFVWVARADLKFDRLKIGSKVYTNAVVTTRTSTDVYISYQGGFENLKVYQLDAEALAVLGYKEEAEAKSKPPISITSIQDSIQENAKVQELQKQISEQVEGSVGELDPKIIAAALAGLLLLYIFYCYCNMLICRNAGTEPGVLVWIPILQVFPMLRAAGMPGWWFILFLLPIVNIVVSAMWCFKIAEACGKSALVGFLLLLPVTNFLAYLYLAFSSKEKEDDSAEPIKLNLGSA